MEDDLLSRDDMLAIPAIETGDPSQLYPIPW